MEKITVWTQYGDVSWGMNGIKFLCGSHREKRYAIVQSMMHFLTRAEKSEFWEESRNMPDILINDLPLSVRETVFVRIDPFYNFTMESKMTASSVMSAYVTSLLKDIPYSDEYATLETAYSAVMGEYINDILKVSAENMSLSFGSAKMTPKILSKFIIPRLQKDDYESDQYSLTLNESITLQCALARRMAETGEKMVIAIYDGPVTDTVCLSLHKMASGSNRLRCIVNGYETHTPINIKEYIICGAQQEIDLADELAVSHYIEMNMPYVGSVQDALTDVADTIAGKNTQRSAYIKAIF